MVEAEAYLANCRRAFGSGVLCKTEVTVLRTMTDNAGWFDEKLYLYRMDNSPFYITNNQRKILKLLPQRDDDDLTKATKEEELIRLVESIRLATKVGS